MTTTVLHGATDGALAGNHPPNEPFEFLVSTATGAESNRLRLRLIPVACWRVDEIRFAFDSSFITPDITTDLQILVSLRDENKKPGLQPGSAQLPPLSVFGHADPVGSDDYNKALSGRRATAVFGLLISATDPERALALWRGIAATENWGSAHRQTMEDKTGQTGATSSDLIKAYMKALCPPELQLSKTDFLAQGVDAGGKGDYQGCSEFNPLLIFSRDKDAEFQQDSDKTPRNVANAPNRRVTVLLFRPGSKVDPGRWPCPRVDEGAGGCKKRFWSDGEARRSKRLPSDDRLFEETEDTFACRFYHRLTIGSPCEALRATGECFVFLKLFDDAVETVLANQEYDLVGLSAGFRTRAKTTAEGIVRHEFIPDDHYLLLCGGFTETVEVYYMAEQERYDGKPWFMRVRGFEVADASEEA